MLSISCVNLTSHNTSEAGSFSSALSIKLVAQLRSYASGATRFWHIDS